MSINEIVPERLSEPIGEELNGLFPAIYDILSKVATGRADAFALSCLHQPSTLYGIAKNSESYLRWTYSELQSAMDRLAAGLQRHGLRRGMPLATFTDNGAEWCMLMWATHKLG